MRVIGPFFGLLASLATIFAVFTRMWWVKPPTPQDTRLTAPQAPSWLATAAKWWLVSVFFIVTLGFLFFALYAVFSMSF